MQIRRRVERLEGSSEAEMTCMVIVGEPTPRQQAMLDADTVRMVIQIPDNGRGHGRDSQSKA